MPLLLQRIRLRVARAVQNEFCCVQLGRLLSAAGLLHLASRCNATAGRKVLYLRLVVRQLCIRDHLDVGEARPVVEFDEAKSALRIPARANPTLQRDLPADVSGSACFADGELLHGVLPCRARVGRSRLRARIWSYKPRPASHRSASSAAMQPLPAAVIAWR
jgi:hypothetical protein